LQRSFVFLYLGDFCSQIQDVEESAMNFSLPRFMRRTQSSDLQTYFTARDILLSKQIEWTAKPAALLDSLKTAIEALPEKERERVFEDFERVDQLSDEIGQRALQSFIESMDASRARRPADAGGRGMHESIRPVAGAIMLLALMGVRCFWPHNMIGLEGLVVNQA
jgi:hypothetical protein